MPDVRLSFSLTLVVLLLAVAASLLISLFVYRVTVPPIPRRLKIALILLRWLGVCLLIVLLGEPLLSLITRTNEPAVIAVLVDNSKSMALKDPPGDRRKILEGVLQSKSMRSLSSIGTTRFGLFHRSVRFLSSYSPDSLTLDGDATDIASALKKAKDNLRNENLQSLVLITDGNSTVGSNPLYEAEDLGVPVFTVGIGDTTQQKDVLVRKVLTNEITYVGSRVPVNATIRSSGCDGERVEVVLRDANSVLDRRVITLEQGAREYSVPLSFVPGKEGLQKYTVEVSGPPGELTEKNNRQSFFTKVLKSKMRVLMIAGSPGPDEAFIRRAFEGDRNIEVKTLTGREGGRFYEGTPGRSMLDEEECLVLVGFPASSTPTSAVSLIADAAAGGKPILFLMGRTVDFSKMRSLEPVLPVSVQNPSSSEHQVFAAIKESERNNPIIKVSTPGGSVETWSKLPPIFKTQTSFRVKPESEVIAQVNIQNTIIDDPLLVARNVNGKKSLAMLGYALWRWQMLSDAGSGTERVLEEFLGNAVRWLTTREDERRVRVQPTKQSFTTQEQVEFTAQVYDQNYQPVDNARITVTIRHGNESSELALSPVGNGQYEGELEPLQEGDHTFRAAVTVDEKRVSEETGTFSVGGVNEEFLETRMNKALLQQISARTGGKYYDATGVEDLAKDMSALSNMGPREAVRSSEVEIWTKSWMLVIAISLFAVEWFLRKRSGML